MRIADSLPFFAVTNVTEALQIPLREPESWKPYGNRIYNTYRSQPRAFGVAPDLSLTAMQVSSPDVACGQLSNECLRVSGHLSSRKCNN